MLPMIRWGFFWMALPALAARAHAGHVYTVGGASPDFYDMPRAVAAAADGDVLLVRSGTYSGFTIEDKSLVVAADAGANVDIAGLVSLHDFAVHSKIVLLGLRVPGSISHSFQSSGFLVVSGIESLRAQSCQFGQVHSPYHQSPSTLGVRLSVVSDASFVDCSIYGEDGTAVNQGDPDNGASALYQALSSLTLYDCRLYGGDGLSGSSDTGSAGGDGGHGYAPSTNGFLFASGVSLHGGIGGDGSSASDCTAPPAGPGGAGGSGIYVFAGPAGSVVLHDSAPVGAPGGAGGADNCGPNAPDGADGVPIHAYAGIVHQLSGAHRRLSMPTVARESTSVPLTFTGVPGDRAYLTVWGNSGHTFRPSMNGVLLASPPELRRMFLGVVPASGVLQSHIFLPDLGIGVEEQTLFLQGYSRAATGEMTLASPATLLVLDSAF
jgi:hypothetical protein